MNEIENYYNYNQLEDWEKGKIIAETLEKCSKIINQCHCLFNFNCFDDFYSEVAMMIIKIYSDQKFKFKVIVEIDSKIYRDEDLVTCEPDNKNEMERIISLMVFKILSKIEHDKAYSNITLDSLLTKYEASSSAFVCAL